MRLPALALALLAIARAARDLHENCQRWAEGGECSANPKFMQENCAVSCSKAKDYSTQIQKECAGYAQMGECSRNPAFMLSTCRRECDAWEAKEGLRIDRDSRCVEWSIVGRCKTDKARMATTCNTSCTVHERCARSTYTGWSVGICDKALRCEAKDTAHDCKRRADQGDCKTDAQKMASVCLSTCAERDVDSVLSVQRAEMRTILSPHYDVPIALSSAHERCWLKGWAGQNHHKLMLPTQCAAARSHTNPWQSRRRLPARLALPVPAERLLGDPEDALTCPLDVSVTTPRVPRRARNVTLPPHTPHNVTVVQVLASPRVRLLRNFLTEEEAVEILRIASPLFRRSPVRSVATERRTSQTATLGGGVLGGGGLLGGVNWAVASVRARISAFSGYADHMLEPLQVVRYHEGEKYEPHHDLFDLCDFPQKPRRHLTFLIYLNDLGDGAGGDTTFPRLNLAIQPEKGTALVFNDCLDNGMDDERTEHAGTPPRVAGAVKYAINCWIRARPM